MFAELRNVSRQGMHYFLQLPSLRIHNRFSLHPELSYSGSPDVAPTWLKSNQCYLALLDLSSNRIAHTFCLFKKEVNGAGQMAHHKRLDSQSKRLEEIKQ